ncbi:hypothetical protein ACFYO7_27470 [Nocardia salmonicida]|uniref:hypothetical protein n=1 Tax=Nocardia salmonicida TaxID=53431 RepID=UPI00369966D0
MASRRGTVEAAARWSDTDVVLRVSDGEQRGECHDEGSAAGQTSAPGPHSRFRIGNITKTCLTPLRLTATTVPLCSTDGRSLTMVLGSAASSDALSLFTTVTATYCLA